jgi:hypothetical protein
MVAQSSWVVAAQPVAAAARLAHHRHPTALRILPLDRPANAARWSGAFAQAAGSQGDKRRLCRGRSARGPTVLAVRPLSVVLAVGRGHTRSDLSEPYCCRWCLVPVVVVVVGGGSVFVQAWPWSFVLPHARGCALQSLCFICVYWMMYIGYFNGAS